MNNELKKYVDENLKKGYSKEELKKRLLEAGYLQEDINNLFPKKERFFLFKFKYLGLIIFLLFIIYYLYFVNGNLTINQNSIIPFNSMVKTNDKISSNYNILNLGSKNMIHCKSSKNAGNVLIQGDEFISKDLGSLGIETFPYNNSIQKTINYYDNSYNNLFQKLLIIKNNSIIYCSYYILKGKNNQYKDFNLIPKNENCFIEKINLSLFRNPNLEKNCIKIKD